MVTASAGVKIDLSKVVHPSYRPVCHSSEPQSSTVHISSPGPKCLGHRCSEHKLVGSHCLFTLPWLSFRVIQKIKECEGHIIVITPGWPGMSWFWDLVQPSTEIPHQLPVSATLLKQSHSQVFHNNPQFLNLHAYCLGVDSSKNKASLWKWQRELQPLKDCQRGLSTNQSGPCLRDLKHFTLITAFLLALASGKHRSEIHAWVANKVSNLGNGKRWPCSLLRIS